MNRLDIRSTSKTVLAASLILAMLARLPFAGGVLLHDHSDRGIHAHYAALDDVRDGDLCEAGHGHHHDDEDSDAGGDESPVSLFLFVNDPAAATRVHGSAGAAIASIRHLASKVTPRSTLSSDPIDSCRFLAAHWSSAPPLRPACALDALLQSSHALLL